MSQSAWDHLLQFSKLILDKIDKKQATNLTFDIAALWTAWKFALNVGDAVVGGSVLIAVVLIGFSCVLWVCKQ